MSETFQGQKLFTQQAENEFWDEISMEISKGLNERKNNKNKIIEYLNEKRNTINLNFSLKRYICENFSIDFNKAEDKYICVVKLENDEIKKFSLDNFQNENCSIDEYIEFIKILGDKNGIKVTKQVIKNWLEDKPCTRKTFLGKLSFLLEMNPESVGVFLNKSLSEKGYNFRDPEEIIYYFCHNNKLKAEKAEELIKEYGSIKNNSNDKYESKHTETLKNEIKNISEENEVLEYLKNNKSSFTNMSTSIRKEFTDLIDVIKKLLELIYPSEDINNDFLERFMLQGIPRETKGQNTKNNTASEFVSHKSSKLKDLLENILKRDKIDKKLQGKAEATRKDLIFLSFIKFTLLAGGYEEIMESDEFGEESVELSEEQEKNPVQNMLYFREIIDAMLLKNGMGQLYIPNRFDNLILLSLCSERAYEYFSDVIEDSFPIEKTGEEFFIGD